MKKTILFIILAFAVSSVYAQSCTPDTTITEPGIYPDYLDTGTANLAYEHVLQVLAIKDTTVELTPGNFITATVDSIVLKAINGLPGDFSYACEPPRCKFTNAAVGCVVLRGNPTSSEIGVHPLEIIVTSYARYNTFKLPVTDTLEDYVLVIQDTGTAGYNNLLLPQETCSFWPNPDVNGTVYFSTADPVREIRVANSEGRIVLEQNYAGVQYGNIDITALPKGIYIFRIFTDDGVYIRRLIH